MYEYTAPSTVLLALRQRFQVAGSIRVKGSRMGTRFPHSHIRTVSMHTVPQSPCVTSRDNSDPNHQPSPVMTPDHIRRRMEFPSTPHHEIVKHPMNERTNNEGP